LNVFIDYTAIFGGSSEFLAILKFNTYFFKTRTTFGIFRFSGSNRIKPIEEKTTKSVIPPLSSSPGI